MPVFTGGNKRGQDTKHGFLSPLDSPYLPLRRDALRLRGETGVTGGSVPCVGQILGRCIALNLLCVICRAYQCAARQCRAAAFRCEKLRFHQALTLGSTNVPVGPSLLDARPKGVASQGKVGESRGAGKPWCPCPFCLRRETPAIPPPPSGGNPTPCHGEHPPARKGQSRLHRLRRCIGGKAYRRQTVKSIKARCVR